MSVGEKLQELGIYGGLKGVVILLVSLALVDMALGQLEFFLQKDPKDIQVSQVNQLKNNLFVKVFGALDWKRGLEFKSAGGIAFSLVPVQKTDNKLIVYLDGFVAESEKTSNEKLWTGRIVGPDWADEWNVGTNRIKLPSQFARTGVSVPDSAWILEVGARPGISIWKSFVGLVGLFIILHFLYRLTRLLTRLSSF